MQEDEFKPFFDKWYRAATINAAKFLWRTDDVEDIVLDSFTATWQNLHKLPLPSDAARFLMFVLKRRCINQNRAISTRKEFFVYSMETDQVDYNLIEIGSLITVDMIEKFESFVYTHCTEHQQEIIAHFMLGKNNTEIGAAMDINHRTVSTIKLRVFDSFKKWLKNENQL